MKRAVFLDRDGTIIEDAAYLREPGQVRLLPGAARAVARLNSGGFLAIVATNQSGIARGLFTEKDYHTSERRVDELLAEQGARLDAHYFCPHLPELSGACECRKPGTLLYRQAADRFGLDLKRSWWVGDRIRDLAAAEAFGASGVLVHTGAGEQEARLPGATRFLQASDLENAVDMILRGSHYLPPP